MPVRDSISLAEARRLAMAAQGFDRPRPAGQADVRALRRVLDTLGLLQLDYVNVLMPAQLLVLWSRLGAYDRSRFQRLAYEQREFTEQWAHEASIVPVSCWPLLAHRRAAHRMHKDNPLRRIRNRHQYLESVLRRVGEHGATCAADLDHVPGPKRKPGDWHRSIPRWALEHHFARGALAVQRRLPNFQRVFDIPERVLPPEALVAPPSRSDAQRELLRRASKALGIGTVQDFADYFRMPPREARPRVRELLEQGAVSEVSVEGWTEPAYVAEGARCPRRIRGASLLSPFDPLVFYRPRGERLFDFHYRIEIYVPAAKRKWGYYVLPFRIGDRIVARVDLKADRSQGTLRVLELHEEACADREECTRELGAELQALANWLELERIDVRPRNAVGTALARQTRRRGQ